MPWVRAVPKMRWHCRSHHQKPGTLSAPNALNLLHLLHASSGPLLVFRMAAASLTASYEHPQAVVFSSAGATRLLLPLLLLQPVQGEPLLPPLLLPEGRPHSRLCLQHVACKPQVSPDHPAVSLTTRRYANGSFRYDLMFQM